VPTFQAGRPGGGQAPAVAQLQVLPFFFTILAGESWLVPENIIIIIITSSSHHCSPFSTILNGSIIIFRENSCFDSLFSTILKAGLFATFAARRRAKAAGGEEKGSFISLQLGGTGAY
jgi:hypothetical protein